MKIKYIAAVLLGACLLPSCKIGKKYVRPDLHLPDAIVEGKLDSLTLADEKWWQIYSDTLLQQLIHKTLEYNKDMLTATARIQEMAERKRISYSKLFPEFKIYVHGERETFNMGLDDAKIDDTFEGKGLFSWELDLWGNLRWKRSADVADYLASAEARRALQMTLVSEVAQSYFELAALEQELRIVNQTVEARKEGVRLAKLRFSGGLTSETAYQQSEVELAKTQTLIPELERNIRLKRNDISFLTGDYPHDIQTGNLARMQDLPLDIPVGLPSTLLERRPDVRQAEQKLIAAHAGIGVAFTNMFPKITLTGYLGLESESLASFLKSPYGYIEGNLLSPLFAFGKNRAAWRASKSVYEQELYQYEKKVLQVFKEVDNAIINYQKTKDVYNAQYDLEKAAQSYLRLANLQYINGIISYIDVLDAQRAYFSAQTALNNAVRDELISVVKLYKALGGGWE
ncbi:MAG: efflux transporter outer membrane subunit [Coprobacter sp.]|nr:efflux transporter outer membrane subunit [Coprobacter sp.]